MAYKYDVFLSYSRLYPMGDWVNDIFFPLFKPYLDDALNKDTLIFKDILEIKSGNDWAMRIRNGLIHSKVMVSIFNPGYFRSEWCMREFAVMNHRQKELGYLTQSNPNGLIVPVKIFDGEHFPDYATCIQTLDCIKYNRVGPAVKNTPMFLDFQEELQKWVYQVASAIEKCPDWDAQWLENDWVDKPYDAITLKTIPIISAPTL